jgi:hypothetical protein
MHAYTRLPNACTTSPVHETLMYSVLHYCSRLPDLGLLFGLAFWGLLGRSSSFWRGITGSSFSRVGEGNKAPSTVTKSFVPSWKENYKVVQIWPGQTVTYLHTNRPGYIWTTLYHVYLFPILKTGNQNLWCGEPKELTLNSHFYSHINNAQYCGN